MLWLCLLVVESKSIESPPHMVEQVLNNDLMSRSSSLHQGSETRPRLPVGEGNIIKVSCLGGALQQFGDE